MTDWAGQIQDRVRAEISRLRGKRSLQSLADATAEVGFPLSRTTIHEIESGKRKSISVQELIALALALGVPPAQLLFPGVPAARIEYAPGERLYRALDCIDMFSGAAKQPGTGYASIHRMEIARAWEDVRLAIADAALDKAAHPGKWTDERQKRLSTLEREKRVLEETMRATGGFVLPNSSDGDG